MLLVAIDVYADHPGRAAEVAMFAGLVLAGFLVLLVSPRDVHPAGVTAIVIGIPFAFGWWLLPHAHRFADVRPFLLLTIAAWVVCFAAPRTRGRPIFLAFAALFLWFWVLGEVVGTDSYSLRPIPSPPAHTLFSLSALREQTTPSLSDLDSSNALYSLAEQCDQRHDSTCLQLYFAAPFGSDFRTFGQTCGGTTDGIPAGCSTLRTSGGINPLPSVASGTRDKSTEIGFVSLLFGLTYLAALWVLDRRNFHRIGTAFVVPGVIALITGTQTLGNATHHLWVGGLLTAIGGLVIGAIGDRTGRRFTAWFGGFTVAYGAMIIAVDAAHIKNSVSNGNVKLAGPGFIVIAFGVGLVSSAYVIAQLLRHSGGGNGAAPAASAPPFVTDPTAPAPWGSLVPGPTPPPTTPPVASWPGSPAPAPAPPPATPPTPPTWPPPPPTP